ncbi:hypothetical protein BX667DRAFT_495355 [Coemansia mojavensis]|nr:hypothetical protein BX667DRAFT_495355 [Coemansia mojavensis]
MTSNPFFVDGEPQAQIAELAQFIAQLKQADTQQLVEEITSSSDPLQALLTASEKVLISESPEECVEAAYNQLFAIAPSIDGIAETVARDIAVNAHNGVAGLRVLNTLYNLSTTSKAAVFSSIIELAARFNMLNVLVPQISYLSAMNIAVEHKADILIQLRDALDKAQLSNEAYEVELAFLDSIGTQDTRAVAVASSAIVRFVNLTAVCDLDALAGLESIQQLNRQNQLGIAGELLNALLECDYHQWLEFAKDKQLSMVNMEHATDKIRLLTVASLAAKHLGEPVSFNQISQAIGVDADEVEVWIIDVIRAGLIQGKMNQVDCTLVPTRSTYRSFGKDQWQLLSAKLDQWKQSLAALQPVIANAKLVAQQQMHQQYESSQVTIKN